MKLVLSDRVQNILGIGLLVMILGLFATFLLWPEDDPFPPIVDVQMHYHRDAWHTFSPRAVIGVMKELDVRAAIVSSAPNQGTFKLSDEGFLRVLPSLTPYRSLADRHEWFTDNSLIEMMSKELNSGLYHGIGEVHMLDGQVRGPVVQYLLDEAVRRNMVVLAHTDANGLKQIMDLKPETKVLWAHAGMTAKSYIVEGMLIRYENLMVELSHRTDLVDEGGTLKPDWRKLLTHYPKRFMVGSGTYNNSWWYEYRYIIRRIRKYLQQLPRDVAEDIGYRNAMQLYSIAPIK